VRWEQKLEIFMIKRSLVLNGGNTGHHWENGTPDVWVDPFSVDWRVVSPSGARGILALGHVFETKNPSKAPLRSEPIRQVLRGFGIGSPFQGED